MDVRSLIFLVLLSVGLSYVACDNHDVLRCVEPEIRHGDYICDNGNFIGSTCRLTCDIGYTVSGEDTVTCLRNAQWNRPLSTCVIPCPSRPALVNGNLDCQWRDAGSMICTATCNNRYELVGEAISRCNEGVWDYPVPECKAQPCPAQELESGSIICTNGWEIQSICTFNCEVDGYELVPSNRNNNRCKRNLQWTKPAPCCAKPCPANAFMDVVMVIDSSSSIGPDNWVKLTTLVGQVIRGFTVASDAVNFAIFRYNRVVDSTTQIFLNSYPNDVNGLLDALDRIPYDGSGTMTGNALRHALEVSLSSTNGNRANALDLVVLITDGKSQDDPITPANKLREEGAKVVVVGIDPPSGQLDIQELKRIAGRDNNSLMLLRRGFGSLTRNTARKLVKRICDNRCPWP